MNKVKIERLNDQLEGIGYIDGKIIFVPKTLVGDEVSVKVIYETKSFLRGKVINHSKKTDCPYFYECGGCDLRNIDYKESLILKKNNLIKLLKKNNIEYENFNLIENKYPNNYRNKISLKIVNGSLGFFEEKTNDVIPIDYCLLAKDEINNFIKDINSFNILNGLITIRCNYNNELLINLETKDNVDIDITSLKNNYKIAGFLLNKKSILNDNYFFDKINNYLFKISYNSFFQINNYCAGKIFDIISENLNKNDEVLDLYSGVGTLSICASKKAINVTGVEVVKNAVLNALDNKRINKASNTEFILGDVPKVLTRINKEFNTLIFDPPRSGLDKFTINYTLEHKPNKIIYVSCNPITLVRDLSYLKDIYQIKEIYLIDMFSYTHHYETVSILYKK